MGFKNMKRDDHGHVISNDEQDGQKCQHGAGGSKKYSHAEMEQKYGKDFENNSKEFNQMDYKYNPDDDTYEERAFDDDYEEEFVDRDEKISTDINEYFSDNQLNELKKYCDKYEVDFDVAKTKLASQYDKMLKDAGYSSKDAADAALENIIDGIVMGDDDRWDDNLDLNNRKTRENLVDDYDKYRASKNFNRGQTVDAPEKGQGWKKTKMASGTLYEGPNGERYMDDGSAPEEIGIDYDNPQASVKYYEKKNNVKLVYHPDIGKYKVVSNEEDNKENINEKDDKQTIIDYYKQKGKDINPELLDKELKSAVHKDFKEGEQVFDTSYGGKGTPGKIVRKLSMKENLDRAGLNNPLAGDYYEIETEFLGIPSRRIVWAGRLNKGE